jgi:hypothetical protein
VSKQPHFKYAAVAVRPVRSGAEQIAETPLAGQREREPVGAGRIDR